MIFSLPRRHIKALYSSIWIISIPFLWIYSILMSARLGKSFISTRFSERLAFSVAHPDAKNGIIIHAASVGEIVAATPLISELILGNNSFPLTLTCTSFTGFDKLKKDFGQVAVIRFLPIDAGPIVRKFLDATRPRMIVLMETELWPNLLYAAKQRKIPVILANARMSARSFRRYMYFRCISKDIFIHLSAVLAQDRSSAKRFRLLGVNKNIIIETGNLKADISLNAVREPAIEKLKASLTGRKIILAASTHESEEETVLQAWIRIKALRGNALLILAPRHPQRFESVARLIDSMGFGLIRRSSGQIPTDNDSVWLADTLGEMEIWYSLADLAFIGGSLVPHGGHNPIEAMMLDCPVISGRNVRNFKSVYALLEKSEASIWVDRQDASDLASAFSLLFLDPEMLQNRACQGAEVYRNMTGATKRSIERIQEILYIDSNRVCRTAGQTGLDSL